jgi:hypothetical protein
MIDSICFFYLFVFWNILYNFYYSSSSIVIELIKPTKLVFLLKYKEEFVLDWTIWAATIESNSKITIGRLKFTNTLNNIINKKTNIDIQINTSFQIANKSLNAISIRIADDTTKSRISGDAMRSIWCWRRPTQLAFIFSDQLWC